MATTRQVIKSLTASFTGIRFNRFSAPSRPQTVGNYQPSTVTDGSGILYLAGVKFGFGNKACFMITLFEMHTRIGIGVEVHVQRHGVCFNILMILWGNMIETAVLSLCACGVLALPCRAAPHAITTRDRSCEHLQWK